MTERRDVDKLESLADKLLSASEKVDKEESLSAEEAQALEAIRKAHPPDQERAAWRWAILAAAAVVLLSVLGFFASSYLSESPPGQTTLALAMRPLDGTRSPGSWTAGDAFVIEVLLSEDRFLHLVHLDANGELEFVFPLYDGDSKTWDYLGHPDNRVSAGATVSIPAKGFPLDLAIQTTRSGEEFLIAFATPEKINEDDLSKFRDELREEVERARQSGSAAEATLKRIGELIAQRFPGPQAVHRYIVKKADP